MTETFDDAREVIADLHRIVTPSGVQENYELTAGGIDHCVYARGRDRSNPVIFFIHGGPASPLAPAASQFQRPVEEYFTVVTYDQRAAGRTLRAVDPSTISDTLTVAQYAADAIELAEQVKDRYGVEKLILLGHSWGSIVALQAALTRPDLFHAYVGIGEGLALRGGRVGCPAGRDQALDPRRRSESRIAGPVVGVVAGAAEETGHPASPVENIDAAHAAGSARSDGVVLVQQVRIGRQSPEMVFDAQ